MKGRKIIFLFICYLFTLNVNGQVLPYTGSDFCFDELIKVNAAPIFNAKNLVVADFNNDGKKEVLISDIANDRIKIYSFTTTPASFIFQSLIAVPGGGFGNGKQRAVEAGSFNMDAYMDIVFTTDSFIYVYKNNLNFNFSLMYKLPLNQNFIGQEHYLKTDNINASGLDDFYFFSNSSSTSGISVLPYYNTGTAFSAQAQLQVFTSSTLPFISANFDINIGDVKGDGDSKNDVLLTYGNVKDSIIFLENTSTGTNLSFNRKFIFIQHTFTSGNFKIKNAEMADINNDSKLDFVLNGKDDTGDKLAIFVGNNTFNVFFPIPIYTIPFDNFKLAEINNDNDVDFVGVSNFNNVAAGMVVYPGNGNNTTYFNISSTIYFPSNIKPDELQLTDVDGNGALDVIFKPWKFNSDHTYMVPNFTFKVNASPNSAVACSSMPATFTASLSTIITNSSFSWKNEDSIVMTGPVLTTTAVGAYFSSVTFNMYSGSDCSLHSDTVHVINGGPSISLLPSGTVDACYNNTISVQAFGAPTFVWSSGSTPVITTNPTFTTNVLTTATYTVKGTDTNGCSQTAVLYVNLYPLNTDNIIASKNPVCKGDIVTLSLPSAMSHTWSGNNFNPTFTVAPVTSSTYPLTFQDFNGCVSSKTITIILDENCKPKIYTGVALHGDPVNAIFRIENIENYKNNSISIFNRWGEEIFVTTGYNNVSNYWPSRNDLGTLTPSTYFYIINYGDGSPIEKGWVELISN